MEIRKENPGGHITSKDRSELYRRQRRCVVVVVRQHRCDLGPIGGVTSGLPNHKGARRIVLPAPRFRQEHVTVWPIPRSALDGTPKRIAVHGDDMDHIRLYQDVRAFIRKRQSSTYSEAYFSFDHCLEAVHI
jgi:hypothetical protein